MLNFQVQKLLDGGCLGARKYLQHKALIWNPQGPVQWHQEEVLAYSQKASMCSLWHSTPCCSQRPGCTMPQLPYEVLRRYRFGSDEDNKIQWYLQQPYVFFLWRSCISLCLTWKTASLPIGTDLTASKPMPRTNHKLISCEQASYETLSHTGTFCLCIVFSLS